MTGPEHYREAERILAELPDDPERITTTAVGRAQAHATLALVAATVNAANVVHWENRDGVKGTSPMDLECTGAPQWDEVL